MKWSNLLYFYRSKFFAKTKNRSPQFDQIEVTPDLIQKNQIRLGKMLLMAGLGLSVLVALEMRQEMVAAIESNLKSIPAHPIPLAPTQRMTSPTLSLARGLEGNPSTQNTIQSTRQSQTGIAVDAAQTADPEQQVSQVDSSMLSTNQWAGSSFPVENFQIYTSPFGYRQSATGGSGSEFHYGLDMAAPQGSYIHNWWAGTVVEVTDNTNCGTSVVVESGNWTHIYCHMQGHVERDDGKRYMVDREGGVQVWEGQVIPAGTRIGRVGMTGRTTGPHLHWGLKYDGNWVDPALVIRAMYAGQQAVSRSASSQVQ
jgi:murein DD-endopeptidase MepM/ murein hydrolase activator NlpD